MLVGILNKNHFFIPLCCGLTSDNPGLLLEAVHINCGKFDTCATSPYLLLVLVNRR